MANKYPVKTLTDFEKFLHKFLGNVFDTSYLYFASSGNAFSIGNSQYPIVHNNSEWVVPFFKNNRGEIIFWMGIRMEFPTSVVTAEPNKISLKFFSGEEKSMVFRAEYAKDDSDHCQPHWHFHFINQAMEPDLTYEEFEKKSRESFETIPEAPPSLTEKIWRMHFPMAWSIKEGQLPNLVGRIEYWMEETVKNIRNELEHAYL
jgi:hypothetical protein